MKCTMSLSSRCIILSLPPRGAWIEIGLRYYDLLERRSRSPRGERGLKSYILIPMTSTFVSLPPRGAWIEIILALMISRTEKVAPPAGSVD